MKCPKCDYQRKTTDDHVMAGICPACGIAYKKWADNSALEESKDTTQTTSTIPVSLTVEPHISLSQKIKSAIFYVPENIYPAHFWARTALLLIFCFWGWSFILDGIQVTKINASFLHSINLPFHEFGHVFFSPFGRFMTILGGSLFQILVPLMIMGVFIIKQKDTFAASICLWWCGQNFIDVSPYIADAPYRAIPLIAGMGEESHDWGNLLTMTDSIESALTIAQTSFSIGTGIIILSSIWGAYILYLQKDRIS